MRKLLSILFLFFTLCVSAQTVKDAFLTTPPAVFPLLSQQDRTALIRYAELGEMRAVRTVFGDTIEVSHMDSNLLILKVKDDAEYTWFLKKSMNSIYFIETLCAPRCHSNASLYINGWDGLKGTITPPADQYQDALFIRANIINNELVFTDETNLYLDETEIK